MATAQSTAPEYAPNDLDALVGELFPVICGERPRRGDDFLFDPATLVGSTRHYYVKYLRWLGLDEEVLPPERILIHAGLPEPGRLERRAPQGQDGRFSLYLDNDLYRSLDAVKMVLAHELTHLYLVHHGHQKLRDAETTTTALAPTVSRLSDPEEVRTEVASILLGFGRLVLNGVCDYARLHAEDGRTGQLGYLTIPRFVHVYRRVNELVGVGREAAAHGLNGPARQTLNSTS
ncbi:hypothetical protein IM697_21775 [Streptomyces ferrugineus]|uniref:Uncharacterized protein n=1 Tax=Streptomyces ferrugineus TaxID=1413221 RepID=A0A7M2SZ41_9ACTN|nr:hypothetical protein [Streptomyces ferrugineus]QOV40788.1 hypothetical protein IM697_21775 [Streptomyces ferrugineus]